MAYDPTRDIDRLEARLNREMDRRFEDLYRRIESLEKKLDEHITVLETRQYEKSTWSFRQIITILISLTAGGGAIGIVQAIINLLTRR